MKTAPTPERFGTLPSGEPVHLYRLIHDSGNQFALMDYGATLVSWLAPDRDGTCAEICLGFDDLEGYLRPDNPHIGATIGRFANRIAGGRFTLDGRTFELARNSGPNHLHGGERGFDKALWRGVWVEPGRAVRFEHTSPDGDEGYPGEVSVAVTFSLLDDGSLEIEYRAESDAATPLNLTNHAYFNLAGAGTVAGHKIRICAGRYTPPGAGGTPSGEIVPVDGTAMDFRERRRIGDTLGQTGLDPEGYDFNYVLDGREGELRLAAEVCDPGSGRTLEVHTTEPGLQFYTSNNLDGSLVGRGGVHYQQHAALCLETQHFPDSPNMPQFPDCILRPGTAFRSVTRYKARTR